MRRVAADVYVRRRSGINDREGTIFAGSKENTVLSNVVVLVRYPDAVIEAVVSGMRCC